MTKTGPHFAASLSIGINDSVGSNHSSDSRLYGPSRAVKLARVTPSGGGSISKSEDGSRCAVAGKESLRIVRVSSPQQSGQDYHKSAFGAGGYRVEASRNLWDGSGLKVDSASTDVAWGHSATSTKILTSARNGELIIWDLEKSGATKFERKVKDHTRAINQVSISPIVPYYCVTASADGDMRVWDMRDTSKSILRIHHPTSVRSVVFSPCVAHPLQTVVGLDNGSLYRWDLKMGAKGHLDKILLAHTAPITALDWCSVAEASSQTALTGIAETYGNSLGWLATGGLDKTVQVWDLNSATSHMPHKPTYDLHPSFPIHRVQWRPSYACELAITSNADLSPASTQGYVDNILPPEIPSLSTKLPNSNIVNRKGPRPSDSPGEIARSSDPIEIWDVRRGYLAKWRVAGSGAAGGVTDMVYGDSQAIWAQHGSGLFSQFDLRETVRCIDSIPRVAASWSVDGSLAFVSDRPSAEEIPYDDVQLADAQDPCKALGDFPYAPTSQSLGTYHNDLDISIFTKLALTYVLDWANKSAMCKANSAEAFAVGRAMDGQAWLLLGVALEDIYPPVIPDSYEPVNDANLATGGISQGVSGSSLANFKFPETTPAASHRSPLHKAATSLENNSLFPPLRSGSRHGRTPTSSNSPSPIHLPSPLPHAPFSNSILGRRSSQDATASQRRPSTYRRPSVVRMESPLQRPSSSSDKHIGEGALDDSDSSSNEDSDDQGSSDEEPNLRPLISPPFDPARMGFGKPSPLSRLVKEKVQWTEDEDGSSSDPSPQSTETDSDGSSAPRKRTKSSSRSRRSIKLKSRSRSSTIVSATPTTKEDPRLKHQPSSSSIRTVIASHTSTKSEGLEREETLKPPTHTSHKSKSRNRPRPSAVSASHVDKGWKTGQSSSTERSSDVVHVDEKKIRGITFLALQNALDSFADQGNIQLCAMFAILAPKELGLRKMQVEQYIEGYLELLMRSRLHTCAAYVRKHCGLRDLQEVASAETTLYTMCFRCKKPLLQAAGCRVPGELPKGGFSYCISCRQFAKCAICHIPVQTLFFQCSICGHGGHQACYRQYYMIRPMSDIPPVVPITTPEEDSKDNVSTSLGARSNSTIPTVNGETGMSNASHTPLMGHLCAAGCGHYCWVVFENQGNVN